MTSYYNLTRKAAYSFLASITTREDEGNKSSKSTSDSPTLSTKSYNESLSPDPPDLDDTNNLEFTKSHTIEISTARVQKKTVKKTQRALAATNFLSSLSFGADSIPNNNISTKNSLSERAATPPIPITAASTYQDEFEHPDSVNRRSLADSSYSGHHTLSSSPTDLDSDEEPPDISRKQSPENNVGSYFSRRESSYLSDKLTSPNSNQNQNNQPIFALEFCENPHSTNSNEVNNNRRTRLKNQPQTSRNGSKKKESKKKDAPSYAYLLEPSYSLTKNPPSNYNPYALDDPTLEADETSVLASFMELIHYGKAKDSKKDVEEVFQVSHPTVDHSLTLGHIRSLKSKILTTAVNSDIELSSVALAYAYFEKLALKGYINKNNRHITAACCLFLAVKVNEHKNRLGDLIESLERNFDVDDKEIYANEFEIFSHLDFNLFLPLAEFMPHLDRIFEELDYKNGNEYLGDEPFYSFDPPESETE